MSRPCLTTSRIELEPMTSEHLPLLVELDADAEVLRYILGRARDASEVHSFWGPICGDTAADAVGLGWWIGRRRSDGDFLALDTVWAETMAVNQRSRQVMAKLGMRHVRTDHRQWDEALPGSEQGEVVYEISRNEWTVAPARKAPR